MVDETTTTGEHHHRHHHHHHHHKAASFFASSTVRLILCFLGIFVAYLGFGIAQESIIKKKYGENDKFTFIISLVLFQCIFNAIVSKIVLLSWQTHRDTTPSRMYAISSFTYLFAMLASNYALEFVSYPMQVLGKSIKPVPVMLLGVLVARKRYPLVKYLYVLLIVLGVVLFMYKKPTETRKTTETGGLIGIGEFLLIVSLAFDGLTGSIQDKIRDAHRVQAFHMMFSMNTWSCLWASIGVFATGEIFGLYNFLTIYPEVMTRMVLLGIAGACGQIGIFFTIEWFGPLTCSIFTTTRKFFTILCSVIIFGNPISKQQMCGTALVFVGLFMEQFYGKKKHK
ncbi:unnamed protein product [Adineta ricciae]|uniref:Solute carrier family 35 member B1 n=1 Tax=Adineta ricciae TaxID=249248 RepID=A0A815GW98_ADIRI|nr:unnamed protein product [Adineta ricciae]CAF1345774.1 unnamed protein product [Adineta ricciae]